MSRRRKPKTLKQWREYLSPTAIGTPYNFYRKTNEEIANNNKKLIKRPRPNGQWVKVD